MTSLIRIVGLCIAILVLTACRAAGDADASCPPCPGYESAPDPGDFDFYFLVRQWGPGYCANPSSHCTTQPDPEFTLHGLWPNLDNACKRDFPEHCGVPTPFDESEIPPEILQKMKTEWPSFTGSDYCFHAHEWDCHGSCSTEYDSQANYFINVTTLHDTYNILKALDKAQVQQSQGAWQTSDFVDAIQQAYGVAPILHCSGGYLSEVYMCIKKDPLVAVPCESVCVQHRCEPDADEADFCGDTLVFEAPAPAEALSAAEENAGRHHRPSGECHLCQPTSGTCKKRRGRSQGAASLAVSVA